MQVEDALDAMSLELIFCHPMIALINAIKNHLVFHMSIRKDATHDANCRRHVSTI